MYLGGKGFVGNLGERRKFLYISQNQITAKEKENERRYSFKNVDNFQNIKLLIYLSRYPLKTFFVSKSKSKGSVFLNASGRK